MPVTEKNLAQAAAVYAASWRVFHAEICSRAFVEKHTVSYQTDVLRERMRDGWQLFALYDPVCRGIVGLHPESGEIGLLYVDPECWGQGFGGRLLEYTMQKLRGREEIFLTVLRTNIRALRLYERRGFVFSGEERVLNSRTGQAERKYIYRFVDTVESQPRGCADLRTSKKNTQKHLKNAI
ncbi:MAG: GNAT family N-acetyltransferase [Hominenteromicrobium sp.]